MSDTALIQAERGQNATEIHLVNEAGFADWSRKLSDVQRAMLEAQRFTGKGYETAIVPAKPGDGAAWFAVGGVADPDDLSSWCLARLAEVLPAGTYRMAKGEPGPALHGWQTAQYRNLAFRSEAEAPGARILLTGNVNAIEPAIAEADAVNLVRRLVDAPPEHMGPATLESEIEAIAKTHDAKLEVTRGDQLEQNYPMVHAVGRAAARHHAPRIVHLTWGKADAPVLALVGKGVTFDSGGLDIKSATGMALMKKDMGGAAHAIALAKLVMQHNLPVRMHLLVPAVENAISGNALRPGDIVTSRKGLTVEITNTDAEGRLILADALDRASEENPELLIDFATLTGAARVALGPEYPALMTRRSDTADALIAAGRAHDDEPWRLPLPDSYVEWLDSPLADCINAPKNGFAGASVAGLFLDKFVGDGIDWAHFDTYAWRPTPKPGRPKGGEAYGLRASWHMLKARFGA
ncbi:MAG: aminopeptidase [Citromicrobium sp.]|nr:aminopeptidase [Citromicrobium sp.]MAO97414.1 aminopeptidase [Citromicrobium sp.]MAS85102.1 aminopeptidase [Erythrobacteraceae bacterium]MBT46240.1 aminopeptidase [Citromicrobium sp.]|tara:strand:- start:1436 stop:2830 length:1395 start_codon:yes stop_codon:yes gene_type:complete